MSFQVAGHQTEAYRIETEVYEGPLDLLLELIERSELDITRLALAQVTDQYLAYMRALQERNAAEVSAFLMIAARLVQIKSAALLPRQSIEHKEDEEEDPGEALARQLLLYKRFKELAAGLEKREADGLHTYLRLTSPPKIEPRLDMAGVKLTDLITLAREIFASAEDYTRLSQVVAAPRITIREKISWILDNLRRKTGAITFRNLLKDKSNRLEVVVTFLAMLELIKRHIVDVQQFQLFSDISLAPLENLDDKVEGDLEFE
jgi:segregation and condensation protein A